MKLLKETYKTYEGARKRCALENALAKGEFEQGYKAKHYRYRVQVQELHGQPKVWRVERYIPANNPQDVQFKYMVQCGKYEIKV